MSQRSITLHVFSSAKGGVGKSTLAVVCAKLLAAQGRRCVLVDADLTGTSLADGLRLRAPKVQEHEGAPDFEASPTGEFWSRQETERLCDRRRTIRWEDFPPSPPFFNDILIRGELARECTVEALYWKHEVDDGVRYLPSSPFERDISIAVNWLYREEPFDWLQRVMWLLEHMSQQDTALSDIIIDLPPGLFVGGFTHEVLVLLSMLERKEQEPFPSGYPAWHEGAVDWRGNAFLVTTPDMNDLTVALSYRLAHSAELHGLRIVLNKAYDARTRRIQEWLRNRYGEGLGMDALPLERVDHLGVLEDIFSTGNIHLSEDVRRVGRLLRLEDN